MPEESIETIKQSLLAELKEDYEGLWTVLYRVQQENPKLDTDNARRRTLRIILELLRDGIIVAGVPNRSGTFMRWDLSPEETTRRIEREWQALGHEPNIGEIVWFSLPQARAKRGEPEGC